MTAQADASGDPNAISVSQIRPLLNEDGRTFDAEITALTAALASLGNPERDSYRAMNASAIARSAASRLLIVAGPGSGKSFLFLERIRHWLDQNASAQVYVASFVRKLVSDLQSDVSRKLREKAGQVGVSTLHSLARSIVERNQGCAEQRFGAHISVISGIWANVVWDDVVAFDPGYDRHGVSRAALERQFHTEEFTSELPWPSVRGTYVALSRFYNAVGFADMIVLARRAVEENPSLISETHWIIDEYQDFNIAEDHLIRSVATKAASVLLAGDDDQALYQQLKASLPDVIIGYYESSGFANAMLPYCSRCSYYVCLAAAAFIGRGRTPDAINKVYLPYVVDLAAPKVQVVGAAQPTSAVGYIRAFIASHRSELDAYRRAMEAGEESDPYLLILTPERNARFYHTHKSPADEKLKELVAEWSEVRPAHSADYWRVVDYVSAAWNSSDNFAVRKVLYELPSAAWRLVVSSIG